MLVSSAVYLELSCSLFEYNHVGEGYGGAISLNAQDIFLANSVTLLVNHTKFTGNSAMNGGAIILSNYLRGTRAIIGINNVYFFRNSALTGGIGGGGGIFFQSEGIQTLASFSISIERSIFEKNLGSSGGAIYLHGVNGDVLCKHSVFKSNSATLQGGAFYFSISNSTINILNTTFDNNTNIDNAGGAIYLEINHGSRIHVDESVFKHNEAIYNMGGGMAIITRGDILKNPQCEKDIMRLWDYNNSVTIKNTNFSENFARNGGAVSMENGIIYFHSCHFVNNFAHDGGHLINYGSNNLNLFSSTFNNTITHNSSCTETFIHTYSEGPLILHNTTALQEIQSDNPLVLIANGGIVDFDNFTMLRCPVGSNMEMLNLSYSRWINISCTYRVTILRFVCTQCEQGTYSLQRGHTLGLRPVHPFSCLPCPNGADCLTTIKSKPNFWGYLSKKNKPSLKFTRCPNGYCLGGSKNEKRDSYNTCRGKRKGWICGHCSPGYSETVFSTDCKLTEKCFDYWFWIVFIVLAFSMALFFIFQPPIVTFLVKQILWFKNERTITEHLSENNRRSLRSTEMQRSDSPFVLSTEEIENERKDSVGFLEIIFYFYQISSLLQTDTNIKHLLKAQIIIPVQRFINFQGAHFEGVCPIPGLTATGKHLFDVAFVFGTLLAIYFIYSLHFFISKIFGAYTPKFKRYLGATMQTILLGYTNIANVSLALIQCVPINSDRRWFYDGNILCYQWWQIVFIAFDVVVLFPFFLVLAWLALKLHNGMISTKQFFLACVAPLPFSIFWSLQYLLQWLSIYRSPVSRTVNTTEYTDTLKSIFLAPFRKPEEGKSGAVYWQSVLIARRFLLTFLGCFITDPTLRLMCMAIICVLALLHHKCVKPFQNPCANTAETISLLSLAVMAIINMYKSFYRFSKEDVSTGWMFVFPTLDIIEMIMLGFIPGMLILLFVLGISSLMVRLVFMAIATIRRKMHRHDPTYDELLDDNHEEN
ncbi:uncharacterized protein LOC124446925 [Xenia sp. Carnegie-2017]|uniref:uncharacterized protein LOC124446925 n=1 Tax=Xenia sp. Carnegie-2017 TaxID=2897299 RepID=UPI001F03F560|nr:uncharacterized protein LOC124446925 [Xenia sp. Carnegie-2017]